jgi:hypothetical protein
MLVEYSRPVIYIDYKELASILGVSTGITYHFITKRVPPMYLKIITTSNKSFKLVNFDYMKMLAESVYAYQYNLFRHIEANEHVSVWEKGLSALVKSKIEARGLELKWGGLSGISNLEALIRHKLKTADTPKKKKKYESLLEGIERYKEYNPDLRDFPIVSEKHLVNALAKRWELDKDIVKDAVRNTLTGWKFGEGKTSMKTRIYSVWEVYYLLHKENKILSEVEV